MKIRPVCAELFHADRREANSRVKQFCESALKSHLSIQRQDTDRKTEIAKDWDSESKNFFFQNTNLVHNFFNIQQYICYITLLNMFRAAHCSSSGGPIVSPQPLVSSPSVSSHTVCGWRADCSPLSTRICTAAYRG